jgi:hypothetical protein
VVSDRRIEKNWSVSSTKVHHREDIVNLSREDAELFFKLMWRLHFYVNRQCMILPNIQSLDDYVTQPQTNKIKVRDVLWTRLDLIDTYIQCNPDGLSAEELAIIAGWKRVIVGSFQIFRHLKKYTVFIGEQSHVYGVLGLSVSIDEIFYGRPLPILVQAVLLPFRGQIVFDSFLQSYNVFFGGGIRGRLKEEYMAAQQNGRIITTLEPERASVATVSTKPKPHKDWVSVVDEIVKTSDSLRGGPPLQSAAFALLRASAQVAQLAVRRPDAADEIWQLGVQVKKVLTRLQRVLERAER